ncbi:hypothetical protein E8E12_004464 [Didymella heteroderae]|uniref:General transcription and DNA repair factor IIH subunit TFB5 n=1 Tax=Didymella heteroderae TaxID=1769908 RepID=A0A9P5C0N0_9PLEO|nr:hypothetical protein E8E12_004464 [Didymella heteroderae]
MAQLCFIVAQYPVVHPPPYISACNPHFAHTQWSKLLGAGTLVRCDASIKAMLVDIDSKNNNEYIIEELDEEHILVKETKINELKARLNSMMRERLKEPESSDSE